MKLVLERVSVPCPLIGSLEDRMVLPLASTEALPARLYNSEMTSVLKPPVKNLSERTRCL